MYDDTVYQLRNTLQDTVYDGMHYTYTCSNV